MSIKYLTISNYKFVGIDKFWNIYFYSHEVSLYKKAKEILVNLIKMKKENA